LDGIHDQGIAFGKIVAVAGDEPNLVDLSLRDDAEPVVLNLMQPTGAARRRFGRSRKARLEPVKRLTRRCSSTNADMRLEITRKR
jgi:hypothetical protein